MSQRPLSIDVRQSACTRGTQRPAVGQFWILSSYGPFPIGEQLWVGDSTATLS
jgi:hypothetical protein